VLIQTNQVNSEPAEPSNPGSSGGKVDQPGEAPSGGAARGKAAHLLKKIKDEIKASADPNDDRKEKTEKIVEIIKDNVKEALNKPPTGDRKEGEKPAVKPDGSEVQKSEDEKKPGLKKILSKFVENAKQKKEE